MADAKRAVKEGATWTRMLRSGESPALLVELTALALPVRFHQRGPTRIMYWIQSFAFYMYKKHISAPEIVRCWPITRMKRGRTGGARSEAQCVLACTKNECLDEGTCRI